jgi:hypothetical protein
MFHTCRAGESSEQIASRYGVTLGTLLVANPFAPTRVAPDGVLDFAELAPGDALRVPVGFGGTMGDVASASTDTANLVWTEIFPDSSSDFAVTSGQRYAGLASASLNYTLASIVSYLNAHGWTVTYSWEYGTPTRNTYQIDTWLSQLPADTTSNHRWVWIEANRTGATTTIGQTPPWPLTIYRVAHAFQALPGPAGTNPSNDAPNLPAPGSTGCPTIPSKTPTYLVGGAVGAVAGVLGSVLVRHFLR